MFIKIIWRGNIHDNYRLMKLESTLRPWLGITHAYRKKAFELQVHIRNHGRIPARLVKVQLADSISTKFIKDDIRIRMGKNFPQDIIIFPNRETNIILPDTISTQIRYVGILMNYEYLIDKHGEFGLIALDEMKDELHYLEVYAL